MRTSRQLETRILQRFDLHVATSAAHRQEAEQLRFRHHPTPNRHDPYRERSLFLILRDLEAGHAVGATRLVYSTSAADPLPLEHAAPRQTVRALIPNSLHRGVLAQADAPIVRPPNDIDDEVKQALPVALMLFALFLPHAYPFDELATVVSSDTRRGLLLAGVLARPLGKPFHHERPQHALRIAWRTSQGIARDRWPMLSRFLTHHLDRLSVGRSAPWHATSSSLRT